MPTPLQCHVCPYMRTPKRLASLTNAATSIAAHTDNTYMPKISGRLFHIMLPILTAPF